jgi:C1A family cysteine protease
MENKQTGWVPDFPDVKDYTLRSKEICKALQPIQGTQIVGSLESQKESVLELLEQIVNTTKAADKDVEGLYQKLQRGMENEVCLVEAKLLEENEQSYNYRNDTGDLDIERIPSKVFDIIVGKLFKEFGLDLVKFLKEDNKGHRLTKVVYPVVKVIAQILTPIGEHGNLPKAVTNKGIKYFKSLLETQSKNSSEKTLELLIQEIKELKKAAERNHNFSTSSFQSISSWKSDNKYFEYLACSAMLKAKEELIAIRESLTLTPTDDPKLLDMLNKVEKELETEFTNALQGKALPFEKALEFDGNEYIYVVKNWEWKQDVALTIEFWAKVNKDNVKLGSHFYLEFEVTLEENPDEWEELCHVKLGPDLCLRWVIQDKCLVADYSPYLNQWTHVALVFETKASETLETSEKVEQTDIYLYLNGELEKVDKSSGKIDETANRFNQNKFRITNSWKAQIARFHTWNKAWNKEDIRNNMYLPQESEETLKNYWERYTNGDVDNNDNNPNNTGIPSGDTKPKIETIKEPFSKKWMIKEDKNKTFNGLDFKNQTRLEIKDNDYREGNNETNYLQFIILKKHLKSASELGVAILPDFIDLSLWCSEIEDQGSLNSCTASAAIALMEYFQKKSFGKYIDGSRLFLYKATRNLMQIEGNVGTSIRNTMKAMALFGVPPEEYWPYDEAKVNVEPDPFCYAFAQSYQALKYFRLDPAGITNKVLLAQIKAILVSGFPCVFGFTLYSSIYDESNPRGHIPYPHQRDKAEGGHSVVAVGYDDYKVIKNADDKETTGALLIRNSWGSLWGEGGYGWLPYDYVLKGLTADWWSLLSSEWFDTEQFGLGGKDWTDNVGAGTKAGG